MHACTEVTRIVGINVLVLWLLTHVTFIDISISALSEASDASNDSNFSMATS